MLGLKSFIKISFDYFFVWKLILGTSMVEERSLVKHRLKRLLDQSDLDTLVLCEDWLRKRLAASREPCGFNRNPTGSKDRCAVCRVCGGERTLEHHGSCHWGGGLKGSCLCALSVVKRS